MVALVASILKEPAQDIALEHPGVLRGKNGSFTFAALAHRCAAGHGEGDLLGSASFTSRDNAIPYAAHFCEVAVNTRTGAVEVRRYHAVHDSGTPINPELALGQVYGGVLKSIGHALYEEMIFDGEARTPDTIVITWEHHETGSRVAAGYDENAFATASVEKLLETAVTRVVGMVGEG